MKNMTDCLFRYRIGDKIHISPDITIRITHIHRQWIAMHVSTLPGLRYVHEKRKKRKAPANS